MNRSAQEFANFNDFFRFYVQQHMHPGNRWLHAIGTVSGIAVVVAAFAMHHPWASLFWPVIAYGCAWTGHFFIEGNRPATFGHPVWSFLGDFRMLGLMLIGRLDSYLDRSA
jgi:hypothetical protein